GRIVELIKQSCPFRIFNGVHHTSIVLAMRAGRSVSLILPGKCIARLTRITVYTSRNSRPYGMMTKQFTEGPSARPPLGSGMGANKPHEFAEAEARRAGNILTEGESRSQLPGTAHVPAGRATRFAADSAGSSTDWRKSVPSFDPGPEKGQGWRKPRSASHRW